MRAPPLSAPDLHVMTYRGIRQRAQCRPRRMGAEFECCMSVRTRRCTVEMLWGPVAPKNRRAAMLAVASRDPSALKGRLERARADYARLRRAGLRIDMTRGKPSTEQLELSNALLNLPGNGDFFEADGGDARNYFGSVQGLPEARSLFAPLMGAPPERIVIGNNSSLALMHDCIAY